MCLFALVYEGLNKRICFTNVMQYSAESALHEFGVCGSSVVFVLPTPRAASREPQQQVYISTLNFSD